MTTTIATFDICLQSVVACKTAEVKIAEFIEIKLTSNQNLTPFINNIAKILYNYN